MKVKKTVIGTLDRCYSVTRLPYKNEMHMMVAAEKVNECRIYDKNCQLKDVVWNEPGGAMSLVPVPEQGDCFLATHRFYSPNDSKEAAIVSAILEDGKWVIRTLADLPFVHRFDTLTAKDGRKYIIACALKTGHEYKDDWSSPGAVYVAKLPADVSAYDKDHQLKLTCIKEGLLKNHGYFRHTTENGDDAIVCSESGIYRFFPPAAEGEEWSMEMISEIPASDAVLMDLDGDGEEELLVLAPFHGDTVHICKKEDGLYKAVFTYDKKLEFLHAICTGTIYGKPCVYLGNRKGDRDFMVVTAENGSYEFTVLDHDCGPANCFFFTEDGKEKILAANRETNEIALYEVE